MSVTYARVIIVRGAHLVTNGLKIKSLRKLLLEETSTNWVNVGGREASMWELYNPL